MKSIMYSKVFLYTAVGILAINDFLNLPPVKKFLDRGKNFDPSPSLFGKISGNESIPVDNADNETDNAVTN